jgi:RHS repeat-associated protein
MRGGTLRCARLSHGSRWSYHLAQTITASAKALCAKELVSRGNQETKMGTVRYTTINGEVVAELRNGVRSLYVPDSLGTTRALLSNTQTQTDTFVAWPYGETVHLTGSNPTPLTFVGTQGYHTDSPSRIYVRNRVDEPAKGRWLTEDPIGYDGLDVNKYRYVQNRPTVTGDPSGEVATVVIVGGVVIIIGIVGAICVSKKCYDCGMAIWHSWQGEGSPTLSPWQHYCNAGYAHCMACCTLQRYVGSFGQACADFGQWKQNRRYHPGAGQDQNNWCYSGETTAKFYHGSCHEGCSIAYKFNQFGMRNLNNPKCRRHMLPLPEPGVYSPAPPSYELPPLDACGGSQ